MIVAEHQQHAPGSDPRGLRLERRRGGCRAATRTISARRCELRRPVLQHADSRASPPPTPRVPGQVGGVRPAHHHRQQPAQRAASISSAATTSDSTPADDVRNTRADFGVDDSRGVPRERQRPDPGHRHHRPEHCSAPNQLFRIQYLNHTVTDNFSWQRGNHAFKFGGLATFEQKNENAASAQPGQLLVRGHDRRRRRRSRTSCAATRRRLRRRAPTPRPSATSTCNLRFNRFEFYAQDTWRADLEPDGRLRRALLALSADHRQEQPAGDVRSVASTTRRTAPPFANAAGTLIDRTRGDLLVGIIQGGVNSPYGDGIYAFKKNSIQPRVGFAWDLSRRRRHGAPRRLRHLLRPAAGRHLRTELVHDAADRQQRDVHQPRLSNPAAGQTPTTTGVRDDHRDGAPTSRIRGRCSGTSA